MSVDLYNVRVFFDGQRGCVKVPGVFRAISTPPVIPGLPRLTMIDYAPEAKCAELMAHNGPRREMWPREEDAVDEWLLIVQAGGA